MQVNFLAVLLSAIGLILMSVGVYYMGKTEESQEMKSADRIGGAFALFFAVVFLIGAVYITFKKKDIKINLENRDRY